LLFLPDSNSLECLVLAAELQAAEIIARKLHLALCDQVSILATATLCNLSWRDWRHDQVGLFVGARES
jgi:hypothetical protein